MVRDTLRGGVTLTCTQRTSGRCDLCLAARDQVRLTCAAGGETSVLRGPAWNAQLDDVEGEVYRWFEAQRARHGGFVLLIQTPDWEFMVGVEWGLRNPLIGDTQPRRVEMPPASLRHTR